MSPLEPASSQALDDQAVAWLVRVQSDAATADDWMALAAWLDADPHNVIAFAAAEQLSAEITDRADQIAAGLAPASAAAPTLTPRRRTPRRWLLAGGLAAAASIAVVAGPLAWRSYEGAPITYSTGVGETRQITLADGSRIQLDAASTMTVRLGWRQRRVWMSEAQASFDVAKDARRPFTVDVGDQRVRVVGTEFNVRHLDGQVRVTVRRGIVEVSQPDQSGAPVARLSPGQQLTHVEGKDVSTVRQVEPGAAFAWRNGRLICEDEPMSEIAAELSRRYAIPVRVSGAAAGRRFSGVLELGDEAQVVRRLADYLSLTARRTDGAFILS